MKTNKLGKILVVALFVMLFALVLTVSVNAANTDVTTADGLTTALGSAASGDTVTVTATIPIEADTTINVPEGVTVQGSVNPLFKVTGANVTLTVTGKGTISGTANLIEAAADGVKVLLNGGTLTTTGNDNSGAIVYDAAVANATTVELNGAVLTANAGWAIDFHQDGTAGTGKKVVKMTAGSITAEHTIVFNTNGADLPVDIQLTGGSITAKNTIVYLQLKHSTNKAMVQLVGTALTVTSNDTVMSIGTSTVVEATMSKGVATTAGCFVKANGNSSTTVNMTGGEITSTKVNHNEGVFFVNAANATLSATISGGKITAPEVALVGTCSKTANNVNVTITNTTVTCRDVINSNSGGNGTVTFGEGADVTSTFAIFSTGGPYTQIAVNVEGGTLKAPNLCSNGADLCFWMAGATLLNISGGAVTVENAASVDLLTTTLTDGTLTMGGATAATGEVAKNETTGVLYTSLKAAIEAANEGDEIVLLNGTTVTETINVTKSVTVTSSSAVLVLGNVTGKTNNTWNTFKIATGVNVTFGGNIMFVDCGFQVVAGETLTTVTFKDNVVVQNGTRSHVVLDNGTTGDVTVNIQDNVALAGHYGVAFEGTATGKKTVNMTGGSLTANYAFVFNTKGVTPTVNVSDATITTNNVAFWFRHRTANATVVVGGDTVVTSTEAVVNNSNNNSSDPCVVYFTLNGGTLRSPDNVFYQANVGGTAGATKIDVTINGGTIELTATGDKSVFCSNDWQGAIIVTMNGGTVKATNNGDNVVTAFYNGATGMKIYLYGGTIEGFDYVVNSFRGWTEITAKNGADGKAETGPVVTSGTIFYAFAGNTGDTNDYGTNITIAGGTFTATGNMFHVYSKQNKNTVTVNISGGTFVSTKDFLYAGKEGSKAVTVNMTVDGESTSITAGAAAFSVCKAATVTVTVKNGYIAPTNQLLYTDTTATTCTLNVQGGEVYSERNDTNGGLCWISNVTNTTNINVSGGKITALTQPLVGINGSNAVHAKTTISGGEINTNSLINENTGNGKHDVIVSGGKITLVGNVFYDDGGGAKKGYMNITMTGGEITANSVFSNSPSTCQPQTLTITGGTYNGATYIKSTDADNNLVKIGNTYYPNLQSAIAAADDANGAVTIELIGTQVLKDADGPIIINKNVIITSGHEGDESLMFYHEHANGTVVKLNGAYDTFRVEAGKSVTFTGNVTYINCGVHVESVENTETLVTFSGNVKFDSGDDGYVFENTSGAGAGSKLTVTVSDNAHLRGSHSVLLKVDGVEYTVNIAGGLLESTTSAAIWYGCDTVFTAGKLTVNMTGGKINAIKGAGIKADNNGAYAYINFIAGEITAADRGIYFNGKYGEIVIGDEEGLNAPVLTTTTQQGIAMHNTTAGTEVHITINSGNITTDANNLIDVNYNVKGTITINGGTLTTKTSGNIIDIWGDSAPSDFDVTVTGGTINSANNFLNTCGSTGTITVENVTLVAKAFMYCAGIGTQTITLSDSDMQVASLMHREANVDGSHKTTVTINSGKYTCSGAKLFWLTNIKANYTDLTINVKGGEVISTFTGSVDNSGARFAESRDGNGRLYVNVSGGTVKWENSTAAEDVTSFVLSRGGNMWVDLTGGTITGFDYVINAARNTTYVTAGAVDAEGKLTSAPTLTAKKAVFYTYAYNYDNGTAALNATIHGGTYEATDGDVFHITNGTLITDATKVLTASATVTINGGTFTASKMGFRINSCTSATIVVNQADFTTNTEFLWEEDFDAKKLNLTVKSGTIHSKTARVIYANGADNTIVLGDESDIGNTEALTVKTDADLQVIACHISGNKFNITIYGGTYTNKSTNLIDINDGETGAITIHGGKFVAKSQSVIDVDGTEANVSAVDVTISGGIFESAGYLIHYDNATGKVKISGGTFTNTAGVMIYVSGIYGAITESEISGGTFNCTLSDTNLGMFGVATASKLHMDITGGTLKCNGPLFGWQGEVVSEISGGTIDTYWLSNVNNDKYKQTITISGDANITLESMFTSGGAAATADNLIAVNIAGGNITCPHIYKQTSPYKLSFLNDFTYNGRTVAATEGCLVKDQNGVEYPNIYEALTANADATGAVTLTLIGGATLPRNVEITGNVTITGGTADAYVNVFGGQLDHTGVTTGVFVVKEGATLTFEGYVNYTYCRVEAEANTTVTFAGNVSFLNPDRLYHTYNNVVPGNATVNVKDNAYLEGNYVINFDGEASNHTKTVNITGGTLVGNHILVFQNDGTTANVTMSGGKLQTVSTFIYLANANAANKSTVSITGGTIVATGNQPGIDVKVGSKADITLNGDIDFEGHRFVRYEKNTYGKLDLTGGTYVSRHDFINYYGSTNADAAGDEVTVSIKNADITAGAALIATSNPNSDSAKACQVTATVTGSTVRTVGSVLWTGSADSGNVIKTTVTLNDSEFIAIAKDGSRYFFQSNDYQSEAYITVNSCSFKWENAEAKAEDVVMYFSVNSGHKMVLNLYGNTVIKGDIDHVFWGNRDDTDVTIGKAGDTAFPTIEATTSIFYAYANNQYGNGKLNATVNGGSFNVTNGSILYVENGSKTATANMTINGGTFTASEDMLYSVSGVVYITANGGTFTTSKYFTNFNNSTGTLTLAGTAKVTAGDRGIVVVGRAASTVHTEKVKVYKSLDKDGNKTLLKEEAPDFIVNVTGGELTAKLSAIYFVDGMNSYVKMTGGTLTTTANGGNTDAPIFKINDSSTTGVWNVVDISGGTINFQNYMIASGSIKSNWTYTNANITGGTFKTQVASDAQAYYFASHDYSGVLLADVAGGSFSAANDGAYAHIAYTWALTQYLYLHGNASFEDVGYIFYNSRKDHANINHTVVIDENVTIDGKVTGDWNAFITHMSPGTMNVYVKGGTITSSYARFILCERKGTTNVEISGGKILMTTNNANGGMFSSNGGSADHAGSTVNFTMTGGEIVYTNGPVFGFSGVVNATILGGTINARGLVNMNGSTADVSVTITGEAEVNLDYALFVDAPNNAASQTDIVISGGTLNAPRLYPLDNEGKPCNMNGTAVVTITGGIYNGANYVKNEEGVASITDAEGTHYFSSLQAAIDAVTGDTPEAPVTITLVGGVSVTETVVINKNVIITGGSDDVILLVHGNVAETSAFDANILKTFLITAGKSVTFTGNVRYISSGFVFEESAEGDVTTVTFAGKVDIANKEASVKGLYSYAFMASNPEAKGKLVLNIQDEAHLTARHCLIASVPGLTVELNISGGTLTSTQSTAVYIGGAAGFSLKMTGGTIDGVNNAFQVLNTNSNVEITGGTFDISAAVVLFRKGAHALVMKNVTVTRASQLVHLTNGGTLGSAETPAVLENITSTTTSQVYYSDWTAGAGVIHIKSGTYTVTGGNVPVLSRGVDDTVIVGEEKSIGNDAALVISANGGKQVFGGHRERRDGSNNNAQYAVTSARGKYNLTIYNGTFTTTSNLIDLNDGLEGSITIHSGSFTVNGNGTLIDVAGSYTLDTETGEQMGYNAIAITITGGTFTSNGYFINAYAYVGVIAVSNVTIENCSRVLNITGTGAVLPVVDSIGAWMTEKGMTTVNVKDGLSGTPHVIIDLNNVVATATDIGIQLRGCGNVLLNIGGEKTDITATRHILYRDMYYDASNTWNVVNITGGKMTSHDSAGFYFPGNKNAVDKLYMAFNISGGEIIMTKAAISETDYRGVSMFEPYKAAIHVFLNVTGGTFKYAPVGTVGEGQKAPETYFFQNGSHHTEINMTGGTIEGFDMAFYGARHGDGLLVTLGALDENGELVGYPEINVNTSIFYTAPHYSENEHGYLTATIWGGEYTVEDGYIFYENGYWHKKYTDKWKNGTMTFTVNGGTFNAKTFVYNYNGNLGTAAKPSVINNAVINTKTNAFHFHDNTSFLVINDITVNAGNHIFLADNVMDTLSITLNGGTYKALKPAGSTAATTNFRIFCVSLKSSAGAGLTVNVNGGDFESSGEFMWCGAKLADVNVKAGTIVSHDQRGIYFTDAGTANVTLGDPNAINDNSKLSILIEGAAQVLAFHGGNRVTNLTVYGGTFEAKVYSFIDVNGNATVNEDGTAYPNGGTFNILGGHITTAGTCIDFDGYSAVNSAVVSGDVTIKTGSTVNADGTFADVTMTDKANIVLNITGGTFECGSYFIISGHSFNTQANISGPVSVTAKHTGDVSMIHHQNGSGTVVNKWLQVNIEATEAGTPVFTNYSDKMFGQANIGGNYAYFDIHINGGEFKAARPNGDVYFFQPWDGNGIMNIEILDGYFHWENPDPTVKKNCNLRGIKSHGNNMSVVLAGGKFEDMGILIWVSRGDAAYNNISISGDFVAECATTNVAWGVLYVTGGSKLVNLHISGGTLTNVSGPLLSSDVGVVNTVITGGTFRSFASIFRVKGSYMPVTITGGSMKSTMLAQATNGGAVVIKGIDNAELDVYAECANYVRFEVGEDTVGYADLAGAVTYAPANSVLEVIGDHTVTTTGQLKHSMTITGTGTITGSVVFINIVGAAELTFDGDVTYNGTVSIVQIPATDTPFESTVNFKKGIFRVSGTSTNGAVFVDFEGDSTTTVNVYEGADIRVGGWGIAFETGRDADGNGEKTVNMMGGYLSGSHGLTFGAGGVQINLYVSGGTIEVTNDALYLHNKYYKTEAQENLLNVNITGGTLIATSNIVLFGGNANGTINISGGTFVSKDIVELASANDIANSSLKKTVNNVEETFHAVINITGGTFAASEKGIHMYGASKVYVAISDATMTATEQLIHRKDDGFTGNAYAYVSIHGGFYTVTGDTMFWVRDSKMDVVIGASADGSEPTFVSAKHINYNYQKSGSTFAPVVNFTISAGTFETNGYLFAFMNNSTGTVNISGGTLTDMFSESNNAAMGSIDSGAATTFNISGGTINCLNIPAFGRSGKIDLNITGGEINTCYLMNANGTVAVENVKISGDAVINCDYSVLTDGTAGSKMSLTVSGGVINAPCLMNVAMTVDCEIVITGGTFNVRGHSFNGAATDVVKNQTTGALYDDLQSAVKEAVNGDVLEILGDFVLDSTVVISGKSITITGGSVDAPIKVLGAVDSPSDYGNSAYGTFLVGKNGSVIFTGNVEWLECAVLAEGDNVNVTFMGNVKFDCDTRSNIAHNHNGMGAGSVTINVAGNALLIGRYGIAFEGGSNRNVSDDGVKSVFMNGGLIQANYGIVFNLDGVTGNLQLTGGKIVANNDGIYVNDGNVDGKRVTVVLRDFTIEANGMGINCQDDYLLIDITVYSGTLIHADMNNSGNGDYCIELYTKPNAKPSTLVIYGGTFITNTAHTAIHVGSACGYSENADAATATRAHIYGGYFQGSALCAVRATNGGYLYIHGGYFVYDSTDGNGNNPVRSGTGGLTKNDDGTYTDTRTVGNVFVYGGNYYTHSVGAAFATVNDLCTLEVNLAGINAHGGAYLVNSHSGIKYYNDGERHFDGAISMTDGAGVRIAKGSNGLRFVSIVTGETLAYLESIGATNVKFGTLIAPTDLVEQARSFTMADMDAAGLKYLNIPAKDGLVERAAGGYYIRAAIVNIQEGNIGREFAAVGYITYTITDVNGNAVEITTYTSYREAKNARSIEQVARLALKDADLYTAAQQEILREYAPDTEAPVIDFYLVAGQSNAAGSSYFDKSMASINPSYADGYSNIYYSGSSNRAVRLGVPVKLGFGSGDSSFGPELGMADAMSQYYNEETGRYAAIIKYAYGGTRLYDNLSGSDAVEGSWCPPSWLAVNEPLDEVRSGGLFRAFVNHIESCVADYEAMGFDVNIKSVYWMQGESDISAHAKDGLYDDIFKVWISDLRNSVCEIMDDDSYQSLPILVGEISEYFGSNSGEAYHRNNLAFVQMQREIIGSWENVYVIPQGNVPTVDYPNDNSHWGFHEHIWNGYMVGSKMLEIAYGFQTTVSEEDAVAEVWLDGQLLGTYNNLGGAISMAPEGAVVKLLKDIEMVSTLAIGNRNKITLDGCGHKIDFKPIQTNVGNYSAIKCFNTDITIMNLHVINHSETTGSYVATYGVVLNFNAKVTWIGGYLEVERHGFVMNNADCHLTVIDGDFKLRDTDINYAAIFFVGSEKSTVTVEGGNFDCGEGTAYAVYLNEGANGAKIVLNGGTYEVAEDIAVLIKGLSTTATIIVGENAELIGGGIENVGITQ